MATRKRNLSPAEVVTKEVGVRPLARHLDMQPATICRWKNNDGGTVPSAYHRSILSFARKVGAKLSPSDLVHGRRMRA